MTSKAKKVKIKTNKKKIYKTNRLHLSVHGYSENKQRAQKCGKNKVECYTVWATSD